MRFEMRSLVMGLALAALATGAQAQEQHWQMDAAPPGVEQHDGFMLRMQIGPGYGEADTSEGDGLTFSGGGMKFQFDIGGAPVENLILYGTFGFLSISDPEVEAGDISGELDGATFTINQWGLGCDYYLMPINIYLGGALLGVRDRLEIETILGDIDYSTETGFGVQFHGGKEWWVSDNWGLGVSGYMLFASVPSEGENFDGTKNEATFSNFAIGINFSATYN